MGRTFTNAHRNDLALEVALQDAPRALVDDEGCLAREPRVAVRLRDDPRWSVRYTLVRTGHIMLPLVQNEDRG